MVHAGGGLWPALNTTAGTQTGAGWFAIRPSGTSFAIVNQDYPAACTAAVFYTSTGVTGTGFAGIVGDLADPASCPSVGDADLSDSGPADPIHPPRPPTPGLAHRRHLPPNASRMHP